MTVTTPLSAKEVAAEMSVDARTFRKFLREITPKEDHPGQGGRWTFTKGEATKLKKQFGKWVAETEAKETAAAKAPAAKATPAKKAKKSKIEEPVELEDLDPDDEDIEDLEDLDDEDDD